VDQSDNESDDQLDERVGAGKCEGITCKGSDEDDQNLLLVPLKRMLVPTKPPQRFEDVMLVGPMLYHSPKATGSFCTLSIFSLSSWMRGH
jgi:hypothetical protein